MKLKVFATFLLFFPSLLLANCPEDSTLLLTILGENSKTKVKYQCKIALQSEVKFANTGISCSISEIQINPHREKVKLPAYNRVVYSCGDNNLKVDGELAWIQGSNGLFGGPAIFSLKTVSQPNKSWNIFVGCAGIKETSNIKLCDLKEPGLAL